MKNHLGCTDYTGEDFISEVVHIYREARKEKYPLEGKVMRGRSHTVSSEVEDLFGYYLSKNTSSDSIHIDQYFCVEGIAGYTHPDIMTIKDGVVTNFFDLKMDLGRQRDKLADVATKYQRYIDVIRGKQCGFAKEDVSLRVGENPKYNIVIVTNGNIAQKKLSGELEKLEDLNLPDVNVFFLSRGIHPNSYDFVHSEVLERIEIVHDSFNKILSLEY